MGKIAILDELTSNQIAAGEVVERPASVAKELIENSIDAGATSITVEVKRGGISYLKITDNGSGIEKDDMEIAFERHATSKIRSGKDLDAITSFGFRGEALASIASVAEVTMTSKTKTEAIGNRIIVKAGNVLEFEEVGASVGTTIIVKDLFFNTPARYKFLKKDSTEAGYIEDVVEKLALVNTNIAFKYINEGRIIINTNGDGNIVNAVYNIYGKDIANNLVNIDAEFEGIKINGVVGKPTVARSNRTNQVFFVNKRYIKNKTMTTAIEKAYDTLLPIGKFPFGILNIELNPEQVDVNVHPTKMEVRFSDEQLIFRSIYHIVREAVLQRNLIPEIRESNEKNNKTLELNETTVVAIINRPQLESSEKVVGTIHELSNNTKSFREPMVNQKTTVGANFVRTQNNKNDFDYTPKSTINSFKPFMTPTMIEKPKQTYVQEEISKPKEDKREESIFGTAEIIEENKSIPSYKIIGVAFLTYIIIQQDNDMYIIDQHAAHERVMYEKLRKKVLNKQVNKQMLMIPEILELKNFEIQSINENKEMFENAGFEFEEFGENSIKISAVPSEIKDAKPREVFIEMLDDLKPLNNYTGEQKSEEFIYRMACRAAVKANMVLEKQEIESLISQMMELENPFTCPHGRPTAIKFTKAELEKKFKRT